MVSLLIVIAVGIFVCVIFRQSDKHFLSIFPIVNLLSCYPEIKCKVASVIITVIVVAPVLDNHNFLSADSVCCMGGILHESCFTVSVGYISIICLARYKAHIKCICLFICVIVACCIVQSSENSIICNGIGSYTLSVIFGCYKRTVLIIRLVVCKRIFYRHITDFFQSSHGFVVFALLLDHNVLGKLVAKLLTPVDVGECSAYDISLAVKFLRQLHSPFKVIIQVIRLIFTLIRVCDIFKTIFLFYYLNFRGSIDIFFLSNAIRCTFVSNTAVGFAYAYRSNFSVGTCIAYICHLISCKYNIACGNVCGYGHISANLCHIGIILQFNRVVFIKITLIRHSVNINLNIFFFNSPNGFFQNRYVTFYYDIFHIGIIHGLCL